MLVIKRLSVVIQARCHQTADLDSSAVDFSKVIFLVFIREQAFQCASQPLYISLVPREISKALGEIEIKAASSFHHVLESDRSFYTRLLEDKCGKRVACRSERFYYFTLSGSGQTGAEK